MSFFQRQALRYASLPPCGGSGLKYGTRHKDRALSLSPSMRREWIEISQYDARYGKAVVSLHAEGVD